MWSESLRLASRAFGAQGRRCRVDLFGFRDGDRSRNRCRMRLRDHLLRRDVAYRTCSRGPGFGDGFRAGHRHAVSVTATTSSAGTSRIALAAAATVSETASAPAPVTETERIAA